MSIREHPCGDNKCIGYFWKNNASIFAANNLRMSPRQLLLFLVIIYVSGCVPPDYDNSETLTLDLSDPSQQRIIDLKDKRDHTALTDLLKSENPLDRYWAIEAFSSCKSVAALSLLGEILCNDPISELRRMAAYVLGQSQMPEAEDFLIKGFGCQDSIDQQSDLSTAILEAVGKVGSAKSLRHISTVSTYRSDHDQLLLGQARGIYRFAQRNIKDSLATDRMIDLVKDKNVAYEARRVASAYLQRFAATDVKERTTQLISSLIDEKDAHIRMNLLSSIAKNGDPANLAYLHEQLPLESDYRVIVQSLRSLPDTEWNTVEKLLVPFLGHQNKHIARTAADKWSQLMPVNEVARTEESTALTIDPFVKASLYGGILRAVPNHYVNTRTRITRHILTAMDDVESDYDRAKYIKALSYDPLNASYLYNRGLQSKSNVLVTAAVNAIPQIFNSDKFDRSYPTRSSKQKVRNDVKQWIIEILQSDNYGAMAATGGLLRRDFWKGEDMQSVINAVRSALSQLPIPEALETKQELARTLALLTNDEYIEDAPSTDHDIDWSIVTSITDSTTVYIITNRGQIKLRLFPELAPGSVANFVALVRSDFYDNKYFHRVVPNFVIQAGCPRGDGYGSLDYTVRSEVGPYYYDDGGYIGMASAGPDTESTQWFITHRATTHLDGRYTIFGKVIEGMDVVHAILQGDRIVDVRIL